MGKVESIRYSIDRISHQNVRGWAFDLNDPDKPLNITVQGGGATLVEYMASDMREDVQRVFGYSGAHGFNIALPPQAANAGEISVLVAFKDGRRTCIGRHDPLDAGHAASWQEAERYLSKGQQVVAVGFADGKHKSLFTRVNVKSVDSLETLETNFRGLEVVFADRVSQLSEIDRIMRAGTKTVFAAITNVELSNVQQGASTLVCTTGQEPKRVLAFRSIEAYLRQRYAVRLISHMSAINGQRRSLLKIDRRRCQVVFVGGPTRAGKTSIARAICPSDGQVINIDNVIGDFLRNRQLMGLLPDGLQELFNESPFNLPAFYARLMQSKWLPDLARQVALYIEPGTFSLVVIEGVPVNNVFADAVKDAMGDECVYWNMSAV